MKKCANCGKEKPTTEFYTRKDSRDGFRGTCKLCDNAKNAKYNQQNREAIKEQQRKKYHSDPSIKERKREYRQTEEYKAKRKKYVYELSPKQREAKRASDKKYRDCNKDKRNAQKAERRASKLQQTPSWANLKLISKFYKLAKELTDKTGIEHHVDHIIPLQGLTVSGLHIESNLQVIPAKDNLRKSNKLSCEYGETGLCPAGDYI